MNLRMALLQRRAALVDESNALRAAAEARSPIGMTGEEQTRDDEIFAELQALGPKITREEERLALQLVEPALPSDPRVTGVVDRDASRNWGYDLGVRMIRQADGQMVFGGRARAGEVALGECMQAILRAGETGIIDPRLYHAAASGGNTSDPSAGGFSVGTDISGFLYQMGIEASILLPYCNPIEISAGADSIEAVYITNTSRATGSRFGGVRVYRRKEAATVASSFPEEEKFELRLQDLMGIAYQTDRLMNDAAAMGQMYATAFRNEFAFVIDDEIVRGDGVGQMQGLLNSPALISIPKEPGQAAASFLQANVSKLWVRLPPRSKPKAVWLINHEMGPQLDGLYVEAGISALEPRFVNYGPDGILRIKGRPVIEVEQMSALGTQGDIVLADLGEYNVVRKGALEQAESDHVRFIYGERTFRWTQRINGKSHWRTAVTPYKGTATLSPFVTLDTRA